MADSSDDGFPLDRVLAKADAIVADPVNAPRFSEAESNLILAVTLRWMVRNT